MEEVIVYINSLKVILLNKVDSKFGETSLIINVHLDEIQQLTLSLMKKKFVLPYVNKAHLVGLGRLKATQCVETSGVARGGGHGAMSPPLNFWGAPKKRRKGAEKGGRGAKKDERKEKKGQKSRKGGKRGRKRRENGGNWGK